jgi:hypothetical protein
MEIPAMVAARIFGFGITLKHLFKLIWQATLCSFFLWALGYPIVSVAKTEQAHANKRPRKWH